MKKSASPFKKEKVNNSAVSTKVVGLIIASLALVLIASVFLLLAKSDFDLRSALSGEVMTAEQDEDTEEISLPKKDNYYLLYCYDEESMTVNFFWIARLRLPQRSVSVFSPPVNRMFAYGNSQTTFSAAFRTGGVEALITAAESVYGIRIANYCGSTGADFKSMINYIGGVTFSVPEKVDYRDDFNLFLIKGDNLMKGDTLYKYLLWLGFYDNEDSLLVRSEVLTVILKTVFEGGYEGRSDALFSKLANFSESDFTILDYRTNTPVIKYILENSMKKFQAAKTVNDLTGK